MRQSDRKIILWFLVFLFVVIGGVVIFYAQGYRLNFSPLGVQKIGAIYVRSFPRDADVYLDGKMVKRTNHIFGSSFFFLQGGTLMNDLFPKKYSLSLKWNDYEDWNQTLEVRPSLVTEIKYAVLAPKISSTVSTSSITGFWTIGNHILSQSSSGALKFSPGVIPGSKVLDENADGRVLTSDKNGVLFESNLNNGSTVNVTYLLAANGVSSGQFSKIILDQGANSLLLLGGRNAYTLNLDSGALVIAERLSSSAAVLANTASSPSLVAVSEYNAVRNYSTIFIFDKNSQSTSTYAAPLAGRTIQMEFKNNRLGLIQSDGSFFYGDPRSTNGLLKLASDARTFKLSDNLEIAAVREGNAMEIIPLAGNTEDYARLLPPDPQGIRDLIWYSDGHHLFLSYADKVLFMDTEDEHLEHLYQVGAPGAKYMAGTNELYFLDGGILKKLAFPS